MTPDGEWVMSGSKDRGVQFWNPRTGDTQLMLQGHKNSGMILRRITEWLRSSPLTIVQSFPSLPALRAIYLRQEAVTCVLEFGSKSSTRVAMVQFAKLTPTLFRYGPYRG